ncbi:scavenger receptor class B member 1-like [Uloborus diversus]|uniref:scavenger receptor class B member 1-like n=1 Tax=Uloborus diversus TaxID=327109 RepID=UPI002409F23D|nr:scavenger receptor class B member 1-like [Uloborus diversus]
MAKSHFSKRCAKITLWTSVTILLAALIILILFPTIYKKQLKHDTTLVKGSLMTKIWEDIPLPIHERLYFFNITNGDDFVNRGAPLNVTQVGPYTYKSSWVKKDPEWHSNGTVSYREVRTYQFVPEKSVGSQDDTVNTLNGPMIIAANIAKTYNIWERILLSIGMGVFKETIITSKSIRQLVYDGYKDEIIKYAPIIKQDLPFKDGVFSWLYGKNATDDGLFTVFTGEEDSSQTGLINNWNGEETLSYWKGDSCNMVNGTSIEVGPPLSNDDAAYTFFQTIFCRSLTFDYVKDVTHHDVLSRRFQPSYKVFANGSENPENYCYDLTPGRPSGILDVSPCQFGAPVFISFPHFHMADPSYLKSIVGLNPNAEDHDSHLDVEYVTGISVDISIKFQINIEVSRVNGITQFDKVTEGIFPILWADLDLAIDEDLANFLQKSLKNPKIITYSVLGVIIGLCAIAIIVSIIILRSSKEEDEELIIVRDDDKSLASSITTKNHKVYGTSENTKNVQFANPPSDVYSEEQEGLINNAVDTSTEARFSGTESSNARAAPSSNDAAVLHVDQDRPSYM